MAESHTAAKQPLDDAVFVIFGITGDLAKRKLLPALYNLSRRGFLSENFRIIGVTRRGTNVEDVVSDLRNTLEASNSKPDEQILTRLKKQTVMVDMQIIQPEDYRLLSEALSQCEPSEGRKLNRLYYLAVPPAMFPTIVEGLGAYNLHINDDGTKAESRLLIEKPFGYDTNSALELIKQMEAVFDEDEIYRVDHYLAKETAQNILTFRFKNPMFKAVWDHSTVSHILVTAAENISIEGRVDFYESTGALRDLIQSHLLQLMSLVTMEEPRDLSSGAVHEAKLKLLKQVKTIEHLDVDKHAVRGQYKSYQDEVKNPGSTTETYAAVRLDIENERWRGVPILMRSGKSMKQKMTEISFIFEANGRGSGEFNALTIRIQPDEGIVLSFLAKKPSLVNQAEIVQMDFSYSESFGTEESPEAYERVLADAIRGDKTLFTTDQEVLESWRIFENVIQQWQKSGEGLEIYPTGSWGPKCADALAELCGARWLTGHLHLDPGTE